MSRSIRYIWPAAGAITSYFGAGHPNGIDIALDLGDDSPIRASSGGTVSFAGGDTCCSLGNRVEIEHDRGGRTVYGHLESIRVVQGQTVTQGEVIGLGGNTGESDGKHLHFEVHQFGAVVDPLRYLPADQQSASGTELTACESGALRLDPDTEVKLEVLTSTPDAFAIQSVVYTPRFANAGAPQIEALRESSTVAALRVPALAMATGATVEGNLDVTLSEAGAGRERSIRCMLVLRSRATLPNPPGTGARTDGAPRPPAPTPTNTPVIGRQAAPTPRPTLTPYAPPPTRTPFVNTPPTRTVPR